MHRKPVHCILRTIRRYLGTAMPVYAGYAAFFLLIAVIPLLMLLFMAVSLIPGYSSENVTSLILDIRPDIPSIRSMISALLADLESGSTSATASAAGITALLSASTGFYAIQRGLRKLDGSRFDRWLFDRAFAILWTLLFLAAIIATLLFQVLGQTIVRVLLAISSGSVAGQIAHFTAAVIHRFRPFVLLLSFGTVLLIYTFTPGRPRKIREELPGAALNYALRQDIPPLTPDSRES